MMSQELRAKTIKDLEDLVISKKNEILENSKNMLKGSEKNLKKNLFLRKEIACNGRGKIKWVRKLLMG